MPQLTLYAVQLPQTFCCIVSMHSMYRLPPSHLWNAAPGPPGPDKHFVHRNVMSHEPHWAPSSEDICRSSSTMAARAWTIEPTSRTDKTTATPLTMTGRLNMWGLLPWGRNQK
jgi:hypothetical protein